jgi:hypothetical protein
MSRAPSGGGLAHGITENAEEFGSAGLYAVPDQSEWGKPEHPKRGKALDSVTQAEWLGM